MGVIDIILLNIPMLAIGLGIGISISVIMYFYNVIFNKDQAKALDTTKDVLIIVLYIAMLFVIDGFYGMFLSSWLGISATSSSGLRIAEAVIYKDIDKFRETLFYIYITDFLFSLAGSFNAHLHVGLNPEQSKLSGSSIIRGLAGPFASMMGGKAAVDPYKADISIDLMGKMGSSIQLLYNASYGLFLVLVYKYIKLTVITYLPLIMSIFIPMALVLLFIPITRKVGLTIIGLAITLYYLFPVFIIYSDTVLRRMPDFDHRYISSYISPTIVEFLDRSYSPNNPSQSIGYKYAFLERERRIASVMNDYVFLEQDTSNIMEPDKNNILANRTKEGMGIMYVYSFVDAQSVCERNVYDTEVCKEYQTQNVGDFRSENALAPVGSFYMNVVKYSGLVRMSAGLAELSKVIKGTTPLTMIIGSMLGIALNILSFALYASMLLPIPGLSQILYGFLGIPFLPFLLFKTALEAALIAYKVIIYGSITIFLDIFLIITGYRAVASVIGAEQRILGLEKVL
ncbi:MAG: hypothetical protein N3C61_02305 [Candidatus Micrarchaeota archaeon]|nr:hypothetical protein [Candidatus Micrarchaeota archaeon]